MDNVVYCSQLSSPVEQMHVMKNDKKANWAEENENAVFEFIKSADCTRR